MLASHGQLNYEGKKMQLYSIFKYISVSFASIFSKKHEFSTHFYSAFSFTSIEIVIERIFNEFACLTSATQAKRAELVKQRKRCSEKSTVGHKKIDFLSLTVLSRHEVKDKKNSPHIKNY